MAEELPRDGSLKVWWIPQVPGKPFEVRVESLREARLLLDTLARYDQFQFDEHVKGDYCNTGGLMVFDREAIDEENECDGWYDYWSLSADEFDHLAVEEIAQLDALRIEGKLFYGK